MKRKAIVHGNPTTLFLLSPKQVWFFYSLFSPFEIQITVLSIFEFISISISVVVVGMEGVDKDKVQRIVYEMSKGSKYFQNEERKDAFIRQKIDNLKTQCSKLTQADLSHYQKASHTFSSFTHNSLFQCNCNSFSCLNSSCRRFYQLFYFYFFSTDS